MTFSRTDKIMIGAIGTVAVVAAVLLAAVYLNLGSLRDEPGGTANSAPRQERSPWWQESSSWWDKYDPSVRVRIDNFAAAGDCSGLQEQFDIAYANRVATQVRLFHGTADLLGYIDQKMRAVGCY